MRIHTVGLKESDLENVVVWKSGHEDFIAQAGWSVSEAIDITYHNLVAASQEPEPEIKATQQITAAIELGVKLMRIGFAPTPEQLETIRAQVVGK